MPCFSSSHSPAPLAEHGVDQVAVPVDGAVEVTPPASDLQIRLVHVPVAAAGTALAVPAPPEFVGQDRRELGFPVPHRFVAEHDAALEEHLAKVAQGEAVAQPPEHHEGDDVGRVLRPVEHPGAALVELAAAVTAAEPAVALGGALRPLRHSRGAAAHAVHTQVLGRLQVARTLPTTGLARQPDCSWHEC